MPRGLCDDVEFADMTEADLAEIMAIEKKSFPAPWSKRLFRETMRFPFSLNIVIRKAGRLIGYISLYLIRGEVHILNVAIDPACRKKGYAALLLRHTIERCKEQEAREFFLEVRESNEPAIHLYQKLGFQTIGRRKRYYVETGEDALVMQMITEDSRDR